MAAWGSKPSFSVTAPPISFKSIVEQQTDAEEFESIADFDIESTTVDTNNFNTTECSDDFKLAQLLQQIENEDSSSTYEGMLAREKMKHPDQNVFSKISVISRYDSSTATQKHSYHGSNVKSSDFNEALFRESQLTSAGVCNSNSNMFKGGVTMLPDGNFVSKHDKLLNSLSNSVKLSEIEGVGDLSGRGILIGNSVANSIRSSAQKKRNK